MEFSRRQFIRASMASSAALAFPSIWLRARQARALEACEQGVNVVIVQLDGGNDGVNMLIPMSDGTGVGADTNRTTYETLRPYIGIPVSELGPTQVGNDPNHDGELALHPHMVGLKSLYDSGNLAVLAGVHYPNRNLSHDESKNIWYRSDPTLHAVSGGWMGRTMDQLCAGESSPVPAVDNESQLSPLFYGNTSVLAFNNISDLVFPAPLNLSASELTEYRAQFDAIYDNAATAGSNFVASLGAAGFAAASRVDTYRTTNSNQSLALNLSDLINGTTNGSGGFGVAGTRQSHSLSRGLRTVYALMIGAQPGNQPLGCRIFRVGLGGFDTHGSMGQHIPLSTKSLTQKVQDGFAGESHGRLMHRISSSIAAFWQDLVEANLHTNTVLLTFSEFGRRIEENGSHDDKSGTDHGTAAPMFVIAPNATQSTGPSHLVAGVYGAYPELNMPDNDGNMVFQLDFRHMYGEIITQWLGLSPATTNSVLGGGFSYSPQGFLV